ncbi:MAG TPA: hypothetical protein PK874_06205 [Desulfobacteraceae bacterium]|nr:hypothetical protein [Desulfobacteraceae bacterium]HPJ68601.1 hypothetical protein [Desulfobacteraceae bacterium]HPQ27398.1 hypothetical protein [Desulfobacteraceae bacterium]
MNYPAASYGVSNVIPAPNQVRDKLQPESRNMLDWIPDQVRDDKTKQASGILVRRVYGGLVCLRQIQPEEIKNINRHAGLDKPAPDLIRGSKFYQPVFSLVYQPLAGTTLTYIIAGVIIRMNTAILIITKKPVWAFL